VILLVAFVVGIGFHLARVGGWGPALALHRRWEAARPHVVAYIRASPVTFTYLFIVTITTWVLLGLDPPIVDAVLKAHSSNLAHLRSDPIRVLIRSAFWLDTYWLLAAVAVIAVVLAPAERWLGTARWIIVFATGHLGATLITAGGLLLAIHAGIVSHSQEGAIDVGVSYGFAAVAAVFTYRLTGRARYAWGGVLLSVVVLAAVVGRTFTDFGHLVAVLLGFAMWPLTRRPTQQLEHGTPVWALPERGTPG